MDTDTMISVGEAARMLGVSQKTIHKMVDRGDLHAEQEWKGRQRRRYITRESLVTFQEAQRHLKTPED